MANQFESPFMKYSRNPVNVGRMNDPTAAAWMTGMCGDTMEIYLVVEKKIITDAKFFTDGCGSTLACGSLVTESVKGKDYYAALHISPGMIIEGLIDLPFDHHHCAVLAVATLYKAIVDYMLKK
jgi:nitrogen fixation NifU-like protein